MDEGQNVLYLVAAQNARELAKREIAKVAARVTDEKGLPLYDMVKAYRNDTFIVDGFIEDGLRQFVTRFSDCCTMEKKDDKYLINLNLPDSEKDNILQGREELNRFLANQVTALWLATRYNTFAQFYTEQASASMERLVILLRTRKAPTR